VDYSVVGLVNWLRHFGIQLWKTILGYVNERFL
jgi:hypothetical protein